MRSNYFKIVCWIFAYAFVLTGCSDRYVEEKISVETVEDEREESEKKKVGQTETELNSISSEAEAEG